MPRRLALFGGTFDPPHVGHLIAASEVLHLGAFDELLLVVNHDPWQKSGDRSITPGDVRLEMVTAAVADHPGLRASDIELVRGGATYTIDTVEQLLVAEPGTEITLVLGADAVAGLDTWHRAAELADLVEVVAVRRPGTPDPVPPAGWRVAVVETPLVDISSTEVRARCADGRPIDYLVHDGVRSVIERRGLYGVRRE